MLRTEFVNIGKFTVIERNQMNAILVEQGFQQQAAPTLRARCR